jgi:predicted short-subunit dehydrogenase-like oxidoreductase (DUF2520 family)
VSVALTGRGWRALAVAGRTPDAPSTVALATRLGAAAVPVADAGRGARLVIVATPDAAIAGAAAELAPSLEPGALVVHLSGAATLHELDDVVRARPDVHVGSLHPLQTLTGDPDGPAGSPLAGAWCAIDGPPELERLALTLGLRPFRVDPARRSEYHAAAAVASNHLVALLGHVERLAADSGVPFEAFLPLVRRTVDNVAALGPAAALTGPVARGDLETVVRHIDAMPADERDLYRALARGALRVTGREQPALAEVLA